MWPVSGTGRPDQSRLSPAARALVEPLRGRRLKRPGGGASRRGTWGPWSWSTPRGYMVEFVDHEGNTLALLDLAEEEVEPLRGPALLRAKTA